MYNIYFGEERMKNKEKEFTKRVDDLDLWCKKINAMMVESMDGPAPQIFKAILFAKLGNFWTGQHKDHDKKKYLKAEKIIDEYLEKFVKLRVAKDKKEVEDILYEKDKS